MSKPVTSPQQHLSPLGLLLGAAAYLCWGTFPVYFHAIKSVSVFEIVAHRILWSMVFLLPILLWRSGVIKLMRDIYHKRAVIPPLLISSTLITVNWLIYIYAVDSGQTLDASLGYFLNPLFTVTLGVIVLKERLTKVQLASLILATFGVLYQLLYIGSFPWIALVLAITFGLYGFIRKQVAISSVQGLFMETLIMTPVAVGYLIWLASQHKLGFLHTDLQSNVMLLGAGVVTAIPLLFFAGATHRLPLVIMGFLQYISPTLQFLAALIILHEPLPSAKLVCFALTWCGLALLLLVPLLPWLIARWRGCCSLLPLNRNT